METMTMSCRDRDLGGGSGGGGAQDFLGLFGDRHSSSDDLFELVWRGAQPSCNPLSARPVAAAVPVPVPERRTPTAPPSEAEMASWLFPIVCCGEEFAGGGDAAVVAAGRRAWVDDDQNQMVLSASGKESSDHKLQEKRKTLSTGGRRRSHHHAEAHSLTEKTRRLKIKEKLKTLQQLVPGCHNSNQASTLDQTIRYMKSLQQHIQAMSFRCGTKPTSAVYPVVQTAPSLPCWWQGGTSVQGWLLGAPQLYNSVLRPCFHSVGSPSLSCSHDV